MLSDGAIRRPQSKEHRMRFVRFLLLAILIGAAAPAFAPDSAKAAPVALSTLARQTAAPDLTEKARLYCYNRYTGRFLHWGPCWRRHYYYRPHYYWRRHYYRPHYYRRHYWHRRYYW
jgi:hypothetical protein